MAILLIYESAIPGASFFAGDSVSFGVPYFWMTISLNIISACRSAPINLTSKENYDSNLTHLCSATFCPQQSASDSRRTVLPDLHG